MVPLILGNPHLGSGDLGIRPARSGVLNASFLLKKAEFELRMPYD